MFSVQASCPCLFRSHNTGGKSVYFSAHIWKLKKAVCQLSLMFPILAIKCENRIIEGLIHNETGSPISDPYYMEETYVYPNWLGSLTEIPQEMLDSDWSIDSPFWKGKTEHSKLGINSIEGPCYCSRIFRPVAVDDAHTGTCKTYYNV